MLSDMYLAVLWTRNGAAGDFGQGYALLDKLRSMSDPAQRQRCLDDAAGPLFRAAADLAAPGAADGRESYVRGLLGVLAADMMGSYQPEGPETCCRSLALFLRHPGLTFGLL